ncbi:uncharacterized protein LOC108092901 isoform X2 [Drosophila ficusphila]|uniref:uncharacterized protein LOC108092901 isoform X2 n=1 Tax=Drosophila ficusphila TaxID=30025 RepID=UPI0007E89E97|nr:uncharacterized protein LOC108092901 isoform X2 [Drosophila ficusphila]
MLLKTVDLNGEQHLFACREGDDKVLTFYLHNLAKNTSFSEAVERNTFQLRLKFPEDAVRPALLKADPSHAELEKRLSEGETQLILVLKYPMTNTAVPLRWNWQLSHLDSAQFYRQICVNLMATAGGLRDQVSVLVELLKAKDRELKQYRTEGCKLRRVTAVTKPFDAEAFQEQHLHLLEDATAYQNVKDVLAAEVSSISSTLPSSAVIKDEKDQKPPTGSKVSDKSGPKLTPRNRKRQALESNTHHLERKVMQRRSAPQVEYKNSQSSQESIVDDYFTEIKPKVEEYTSNDIEEPAISAREIENNSVKLTKANATLHPAQIKTETVQESGSLPLENLQDIIRPKPDLVHVMFDSPSETLPRPKLHDSSPESEDPGTVSELDELKDILNRTTAVTKSLIKNHRKDK